MIVASHRYSFQALHPGDHGSIEFIVLVSFDVVFSKNLTATVQGNHKRCILASDILTLHCSTCARRSSRAGRVSQSSHVDLCLRRIEVEL